ncbi:MAG: hemerythrin [Hydrogenophaga sp.]|nr:hemerythrin [Hydrogenophaga sp.]
METVEWSEALRLDFAPMDTAHRTLVVLLAQAQAASDEALPPAWSALLTHTEHQFGEEDAWMRQTGFASASNHLLQHRVVLNLLREGEVMARSGQLAPVREMANELAAWFIKHTQSMDAALALHMRRQAPPADPRRDGVNHVKPI